MEGCDYETIAEILELPVGTVRSRLHRARLQLRDQLREILQENLAEPMTSPFSDELITLIWTVN